MKQILVALAILITSTAALAHGPRYHPHHPSPMWWVAPAVIGGVVTYAMTRPTVPEQPRIIEVPAAPPGFHYENVLDARCNCYRTVLVNN
jgi:hypothetical protein